MHARTHRRAQTHVQTLSPTWFDAVTKPATMSAVCMNGKLASFCWKPTATYAFGSLVFALMETHICGSGFVSASVLHAISNCVAVLNV
jgi:hypothetical protein